MDEIKVLAQTIRSLEEKADAYQQAFPAGSVKDLAHPAYLEFVNTLKAANGAFAKLTGGVADQAQKLHSKTAACKEMIQEKIKSLAAQTEAAKEARRTAASEVREKALAKKQEFKGLSTLPFEKAHAPPVARLQELMTNLSRLAFRSDALPPATPGKSSGIFDMGRATLAHEKAHLPSAERLQYLIYKISRIRHLTMGPRPRDVS